MVDTGLHLDLNAPDETTLINWTTVINSKLDRLRCDEDFRRNPPAHEPFPPSIFHFTPLSVADNLEFNYRNSKTLFLVRAAVKVLLETVEFFRTRTRSPRRMGFSFLLPNFFFILAGRPLCSVTEQTGGWGPIVDRLTCRSLLVTYECRRNFHGALLPLQRGIERFIER